MTLDYEIILSRHSHNARLVMKGNTRPGLARMYRIAAALLSDLRLTDATIQTQAEATYDPYVILVIPNYAMTLEILRNLLHEIADSTK